MPAPLRQATLDRLVASIRSADHHLTVGEIALPAVVRVLAAANRHDVLSRVFTQTTAPSYGYQVLAGATSLAEAWDGPTKGLSQNHFMLGAIASWLGRCLGGVDQADDSVGYRNLVIAPVIMDGLSSMTYTTRTPYGDVRVSWRRQGDQLTLDVTVPVGATATVHIGGSEQHVGAGRWCFATASAPSPGGRTAAIRQPG